MPTEKNAVGKRDYCFMLDKAITEFCELPHSPRKTYDCGYHKFQPQHPLKVRFYFQPLP